jgi:small GTP-binding protein
VEENAGAALRHLGAIAASIRAQLAIRDDLQCQAETLRLLGLTKCVQLRRGSTTWAWGASRNGNHLPIKMHPKGADCHPFVFKKLRAMNVLAVERAPKVVLIGDSRAGKTTIAHCYTKTHSYIRPTITANSVHCVERVDNHEVQFDLWDTAGQEAYKCLVPVYARAATLALLLFDRTSRATFGSLPGWLSFLKKDVAIDNILVVGNKTDLTPEVGTEEAEEWTARNGAEYIETSAKTGSSIDLLFQLVAKKVHAAAGPGVKTPMETDKIVLEPPPVKKDDCQC